MTREEKINTIIVNLFARMLNIKDSDVLLEIEKSLHQKDITTKERILTDLYEKSNEQKSIFTRMETEIKMTKNKISEGYEAYFENRELDLLLA